MIFNMVPVVVVVVVVVVAVFGKYKNLNNLHMPTRHFGRTARDIIQPAWEFKFFLPDQTRQTTGDTQQISGLALWLYVESSQSADQNQTHQEE